MNKGKRNEAIILLTQLNENYQEQINSSSDKAFINSLVEKIALNEKNIEKLRNNSYDFSTVKKLSDLDNIKKKPNDYWE